MAGFLGFRLRPGTSPRPAEQPATFVIDIDGVPCSIQMKRVAAARRFTLRVRASRGDVVLTLPTRGSLKAARAFTVQNAGWIGDRLARVPPRIGFGPGNLVPFRGEPHRIVHRPGLRACVWVEQAGATVEPLLCVGGPSAQVATLVERHLRGEAGRDLAQCAARHAAAVGRPISGLALRDTRSRWGSCTATGRLSFSWRLIMAPPFVLDYLAAHEVAHLVHLDHSPAFWATARSLAPRIAEAEAWLKQHGPGLHRYGP